jgi:hypothetical protein
MDGVERLIKKDKVKFMAEVRTRGKPLRSEIVLSS